MLCPKCQKQAFPVELRCLKCDSLLEGVPHAFESPDNRMLPPKKLFCTHCGAMAEDARITCPSCKSTLPRPFSLVAGDEDELINEPGITRFEISCSDGACEECKKLEVKRVSKTQVKQGAVPIPTCRHPMCWCMVVGTGSDEGTVTLG